MKTTKTQTPVSSHHCRRDRGFTLVELLVVITIVAALAAVTFTVTRSIKNKAAQANALSSLRQVATFSSAYSSENNGDINTLRWATDAKEGGGGAWVKNSFWGRLQPYLFPDSALPNQQNLKVELSKQLDQFFGTPDADVMTGTVLSGAKIYHDGSGLPVPFGFNDNLHEGGKFLKVSSFGNPAQIIYAAYGYGFFNEADGNAYEPMPRNNTKPVNNIYYMDDGKALAAFLDGHVEVVSPALPDRMFQ